MPNHTQEPNGLMETTDLAMLSFSQRPHGWVEAQSVHTQVYPSLHKHSQCIHRNEGHSWCIEDIHARWSG